MRVLFLSSEFPTRVDPHRAVFNRHMIRGLASRHQVHVVCPIAWTEAWRGRHNSPLLEAAVNYSATYPRFYFPPRVALHQRGTWMWWSLSSLLRREARCHQPEVVLSYWAHPDGEVALRLARRLGVPIALMVGGSDVLVLTRDPRRRDRIEAVLQGVDEVIAIGRNLRDQVIAMGVPASRVTSVMRPVDAARFCPGDRSEARLRLGLPTGQAILLWVGRLVPVKGVDTLLRAAAKVKEQHLDLLVCIAGEGPEAPTLLTLCQELGIESRVRWLGAVSHGDLPDWYRAADVTVLPSLSEGVPNVLLETVACGTPFVASRVGSISEIADDACDRLVPPAEPGALAGAIAEVLANRNTPLVRARGVVGESEFQSRLDEVLARCKAGARPRVGASAALRSATLTNPSPWRQALRTGLIESVPRSLLVAAGKPSSRAVCLTFDDGPEETLTPRILDVLKDLGAPATFFVRGDRASLRPDLLRRMGEEGHLLGHHSWSHGVPSQTSALTLLAEVRRTREWLRLQLGADSTWFRPPHGKLSIPKALGLWKSGLTVALWNVDPGDVFRSDPKEMLDWFRVNPPRAGDVVLLHDTSRVTLEALPGLIALIRTAGLEVVTLDQFGGRPARS